MKWGNSIYYFYPTDPEDFVFKNKSDLLAKLKPFKDARFKSFKTRAEALKFAEIGFPLLQTTSIMDSVVKCKLISQIIKVTFLHFYRVPDFAK